MEVYRVLADAGVGDSAVKRGWRFIRIFGRLFGNAKFKIEGKGEAYHIETWAWMEDVMLGRVDGDRGLDGRISSLPILAEEHGTSIHIR